MYGLLYISVSRMFLRFVHIVACFSTSLLFIDSLVWIIPHFIIHSSVDRHLGCFHFLAFINNAAMNIRVQVFISTHAFITLGIYLEEELLRHIVTLCLAF